MNTLPTEIILHVLIYLTSLRDLMSLRSTCQRLFQVVSFEISQRTIWTTLGYTPELGASHKPDCFRYLKVKMARTDPFDMVLNSVNAWSTTAKNVEFYVEEDEFHMNDCSQGVYGRWNAQTNCYHQMQVLSLSELLNSLDILDDKIQYYFNEVIETNNMAMEWYCAERDTGDEILYERIKEAVKNVKVFCILVTPRIQSLLPKSVKYMRKYWTLPPTSKLVCQMLDLSLDDE